MIEIDRSQRHSSAAFVPLTRKIIGVGGAGSTIIDRLLVDGSEASDLVAINTDLQALSSSVAAQKIQMGHALTYGLGAGGDPEVGMAAAQEALPELREMIANTQVAFIVAGLGGGTGSGAAPFMAHAAREEGALVIALVTMPFTFEGRRRNQQAVAALDHLRQLCHAVICFENDRMSELIAPKAGIQQAFSAADVTMTECIRGILAMLTSPGAMKVGMTDLLAVLRTDDSRCLFGYGESEGDNRAHEALAYALRNPLMDRGKLLDQAANVLVHISGSKSLTLAEIEILMGELNRYIGDETQLLLGTSIDARLGSKLSVTVLGALGNSRVERLVQSGSMPENASSQASRFSPPALEVAEEEEEVPVTEEIVPTSIAARGASPTPLAKAPKILAPEKVIPPPSQEKPAQVKQEVLQFEPVSRGRFEKSEPTIVEGHDLDVPTVLRKGYRV